MTGTTPRPEVQTPAAQAPTGQALTVSTPTIQPPTTPAHGDTAPARGEAESGGAPRRGRGRRPADEVRADVLRTAGALLLEEGIAELTFERVARLSGVSKTTIYKWWPSRGALALDGYFHAVENTLAFPDTGDIRADLTAQLRSFARVMTRTAAGRVLTELIGQAQTDVDLATAYRTLYSSERRRLAAERLGVAREAGQLRAEVDVQVVVDQLWGAVYHRLLIPDEPVTDAFITALVGNLLDGIAAR
ncbi:MAG TPA: TetR/AcrR family transcriptional regulator C-terminal ligand-binding domain-containing protein [Gryllotalpicola sp.]